jgi:hypothetical protein
MADTDAKGDRARIFMDGLQQGEQRCHGACNVGRQPIDKAVQAWEIAGRPLIHTDACHHQPPSRNPGLTLPPLTQFVPLHDAIRVLRITTNGLRDTTLDVSPEQVAAFRANATEYELNHSGMLHPPNGAVPVVDDAGTVLAYLDTFTVTGVHHLLFHDINGEVMNHQTQEEPLQADTLGNEIVATVVTLGGALVLRAIARSVLARAATSFLGKTLTDVSLAAARGISPEAERAMFLFLRSLRAQRLVSGFVARGLRVTVNIGGEGAPGEIAKFGEHITVSLLRPSVGKRYIANLIKEPGENIARLFRPRSIDRIVSRELDVLSLDTDRLAEGSFEVLRPGGTMNMEFHPGSLEAAEAFGQKFFDSLVKAGFDPSKIRRVSGFVFDVVK